MAQDINIKMTLTDGGTVDARVSDAKRLNKELDKTADTVERINSAQSRIPRSASAALDRSGPSAKEVVDYNAQRGAAGAAGGTARDFAAQAQGLGGLVRLYATFAANIFAVTTAFNALKQAANTEKMIQASERFSATVGVNLRAVSKDLQEATQYSLTFAEAVKFTNVGTAAGLAAKDIQNLTVIAKGAATALGRDVGESIQRIIQGTAKQEQEILDELGIFIKSKKAFEEYAAARNMKADDLTATQRTLAYAEAVAKAGEKWKEFADIDDPFGRLSAELQNTLNQVLSTVNKVAAPIAAFFADNSKAILALAALITSSLVQRALPELKTALLSSITFDSQRAKLAAAELRTSLTQELAEVSRRAEDAAKKLKDFQATSVDLTNRTARGNIAKASIPKEFLANKNEAGLNAGTIGTALFSPKNLANIKTFQDAQEAVLGTVREQLKDQDKQAKVMQDLVNKGVLTKESTAQNLVLTQESNKAVAALYSRTQDLAKKQEESNRLNATALATDKERLAISERLNKAGGAVKTVPLSASASLAKESAAALEGVVVSGTKAERTAQSVANSVGKSVAMSTAFAGSFSKVSKELADTRIAAAGEGIFAQFKAAGATLVGMNANIATATAGITGFGKAGATAGAIAASSLGAVRLALGGVMAALGPIMLAWTVWELAGPWIKETFLGISQELEKLKTKAKEAAKELQDSFVILEKTFNKANAVLSDPTVSTTGVVKSLEAKSNALRTILDALQKEQEAKKSVADFKAPGAVNSKINLDTKAGDLLNASQSIVFLAKEFNISGTQVEAFSKKYSELQETLKRSDGGERSIRAINVALGELAALKDKLDLRSVLEANEAVLQRQEALYTKAAASAKALGDVVDESQILTKAEAKSAGFSTTAEGLKAFKGTKEFNTAGESLRKLSEDQLNAGSVAEDTAKSVIKLGKAAALLNIPTSALNPVIAKSNELLAINSSLLDVNTQKAKASKEGNTQLVAELTLRANALAARSAQLGKELGDTVTADAGKDVKTILTALAAVNGSTSQYTTGAKKLFKELEQQINAAEAALKALNASLDVSQKLNSLRSSFTGEQNLDNKTAQDRVKIIQQEYDIEAKKAFLAREKVRLAKDTKNDKEAQEAAESSYRNTLASLNATKVQKELLLGIDVVEKNRNETLRQIEEKSKLAADAADRMLASAKLQLDVEKAYGDARATALGLTQEEARYEALMLEQQGKRIEAAGRLAAIERERANSVAQINAKAQAEKDATVAKFSSGVEAGPVDQRAVAAALLEIEKAKQAEIDKINAKTNEKLAADREQLTIAEKLMSIEERRAALAADQASASQKLAKLTASIAGAFKGTGMEKQAKAVSDILKTSQSSAQKMAKFDADSRAAKEKNLASIAKATERATKNEVGAIGELAGLKTKLAEEDELSAKTRKELELEATTESLSAFKGMFSEKTAAYKVLDGIERAMFVMRMAESAQQTAQMIADNAKQVASLITTIAKDGVSAVLNQGKGDPYTAFARMAAMAAFVASLTGGSSKGPQVPGGMSAKDKQETQGTGMSWVNGQKVENGNGVFGDPTAKSESIKKSLEIIADNTIEGLVYDQKMLRALEGIGQAIGSTAKSLFSIQGIRTGSAFGTPDSQVSTKGWKGLWGSSTSKDIVDSGIKISGIFADLAKGMGQFSQYETIQKTEKKSGFLGIGSSTRISFESKSKELDSAVSKSISEIFSNATKLFTEVGAKAGMSLETVTSKLSALNVDFEASLKGLNGKELEEALNAVISSALDNASGTLFGAQFKKFQEFGEGLLETVIRVVDSNDKVKLAFSSLGKTLGDFSFDASESLLKLVGGIEEFTTQMEFYRDNFVSETQKLASTQEGVSKVMSELGYSTVDTRAEFSALINSIDLTTVSGQTLYAALMDIAPAFATVTEKHHELLESYAESENELLALMKGNSKAKELLLARETAGMNEVTRAQFLRNRALSEEIKATEQQYELLDELDELILSSTQLRAKERESVAESNRTLYDLVQAYKVKKQAEEDMISSMQTMTSTIQSLKDRVRDSAQAIQSAIDGLVSGFLAAKSNLASAKAALEGAKETLVSNFFGSKKGLEDAQKGTGNALSNITKGYLSAKKAVESAQKGISTSLRNLGNSLKDFLTGLLTSDLSALDPRAKVSALQSQFDALFTKALGGDQVAAEKLQSVASELLTASRETASSSEEYGRIFGEVTNKLNTISTNLLALAGPAADENTAQNAALKALADAQEELARWQAAVNTSGAAATEAEAGLLEEWTKAKAAEAVASLNFAKWSEAVSTALGFTPTAETDKTSSDIAKALEALQKAQGDVALAETDMAAYQAALLRVGVTDLSNLKDSSNSTQKKIEEYVKAWQDATAENALASAQLAEAQALLGSITLTQLDELKDFKEAVKLYNESSEAYRKADDIIKNTSLDNIRAAVTASQNAIVNAIIESSKAAVKVTEDSPTVKIPEKDIPPPVQRQSATEELARTVSSTVAGGIAGELIGRYRFLSDAFEDDVYGIRQFATGGDHTGGLRIVGENGPELEATGPSRIFNADQTRKILSGNNNDALLAAVVAELRAVKSELANLRVSTSQVETNTRKAKDILENVTQGGDTIKTEQA